MYKVNGESIHIIFNKTNDGLASSSSFDEFHLSKYVDDEDKWALDVGLVIKLVPV